MPAAWTGQYLQLGGERNLNSAGARRQQRPRRRLGEQDRCGLGALVNSYVLAA